MKVRQEEDPACFVPVAGLKQVYEPRCKKKEQAKKHPCSDCHFCQFCSDGRCHSCRNKGDQSGAGESQTLSLKEQILLYEKINSQSQEEV